MALPMNVACERPTQAGELPDPKLPGPAGKPGEMTTAVFAGGCFWCTEAVFQELKGVKTVESGYAGGSPEDANYRRVSAGDTDHAEVIRITYDPGVITFGELLKVFFATHDPTQLNRQGPDSGRQYRSAVFYQNDEEKQAAEAYIKQLTDAKSYSRPIVTTLEKLDAFYPAEEYHQDFIDKNPEHPYLLIQAWPKVEKVRKTFKEKLKTATTQPAN